MIPAPAPMSNTLRVDLANLSPIAREFIATSIAIFTDPAASMEFHREQLLRGKMALTVEDGEVTWVDSPDAV